MSAYVVFCMPEVFDPAALDAYRVAARPSMAAHKPRILCGPKVTETLEGDELAGALVMEFADVAAARAWYASPEYQAAKKLREGAVTMFSFIVEGR